MIREGLVLMGAGMGVVLLFLVLMVYSVHGSAAIARRLEARKEAKASAAGKGAAR